MTILDFIKTTSRASEKLAADHIVLSFFCRQNTLHISLGLRRNDLLHQYRHVMTVEELAVTSPSTFSSLLSGFATKLKEEVECQLS